MEFRSFDEWKRLGYNIRKGSKALKRTPDGTPLFGESQVYDTELSNDRRTDDDDNEALLRPVDR